MIMDRLHTILEGLTTALLGAFMYAFSISDSYWMLLSPKFQPLTATAGFLLFVTGAAMTTRKPPRNVRRWGALCAMLAFLALACWAVLGPESAFAPDPPKKHTPMSLELPEPGEGFEPRLTLNGKEYVRISTPELFALIEGTNKEYPREIAMRGMVARSPDLDKRGMIAVFRVNVFCCLADAVAPGFLVSVDDPDKYPQGSWVRVAGEVVESAESHANGEISLPGMLMSFVSLNHEIRGHDVRIIDPPDMPFTFEVRDKEPFAY